MSQYPFFNAGVLNLVWVVFWVVFVSESPRIDPTISLEERVYIEQNTDNRDTKKVGGLLCLNTENWELTWCQLCRHPDGTWCCRYVTSDDKVLIVSIHAFHWCISLQLTFIVVFLPKFEILTVYEFMIDRFMSCFAKSCKSDISIAKWRHHTHRVKHKIVTNIHVISTLRPVRLFQLYVFGMKTFCLIQNQLKFIPKGSIDNKSIQTTSQRLSQRGPCSATPYRWLSARLQ